MENLLRIVEGNADEEEINEEKLRFFNTKVKVWEYFNISQQKHVSLSTEEGSTMLKRYYHKLNSKCLAGKFCFCYFLVLLVWKLSVAISFDLISGYSLFIDSPKTIDSSVLTKQMLFH